MIKVYQTKHIISRTICKAFAEGCEGQVVPAVSLLDGDVALYGLLRGTHEVLTEAKQQGRKWYYIDLGFVKRSNHYKGKYSGYYRVSKNCYQSNILGSHPSDRWKNLEIDIKPWRRKGDHVLICPMSYNMAVHLNMDPKEWLQSVVLNVCKYTRRPIIIKPKSSDMTLDEALLDCHAIIGYDTNALIDAVLAGTPAFNMGNSAVAEVALQDLSQIESPAYPDRKQWCYNLAYNQFTLDEFRDGTAWRLLNEEDNTPIKQRKRDR